MVHLVKEEAEQLVSAINGTHWGLLVELSSPDVDGSRSLRECHCYDAAQALPDGALKEKLLAAYAS